MEADQPVVLLAYAHSSKKKRGIQDLRSLEGSLQQRFHSTQLSFLREGHQKAPWGSDVFESRSLDHQILGIHMLVGTEDTDSWWLNDYAGRKKKLDWETATLDKHQHLSWVWIQGNDSPEPAEQLLFAGAPVVMLGPESLATEWLVYLRMGYSIRDAWELLDGELPVHTIPSDPFEYWEWRENRNHDHLGPCLMALSTNMEALYMAPFEGMEPEEAAEEETEHEAFVSFEETSEPVEEAVWEESTLEAPMEENPFVDLEDLELDESISEEPILEEPILEEPVMAEPSFGESILGEIDFESPIEDEPPLEESPMEEPAVETVIEEEPNVEGPSFGESILEGLDLEEPILEETITEEPILPAPEFIPEPIPEVIPEVVAEVIPKAKKKKAPKEQVSSADFYQRPRSVNTARREEIEYRHPGFEEKAPELGLALMDEDWKGWEVSQERIIEIVNKQDFRFAPRRRILATAISSCLGIALLMVGVWQMGWKLSDDQMDRLSYFTTFTDSSRFRVLLLPFHREDGCEPTEIWDEMAVRDHLLTRPEAEELGLEVTYITPGSCPERTEDARRLAEIYNADLLVWGDPAGTLSSPQLQLHYVLSPGASDVSMDHLLQVHHLADGFLGGNSETVVDQILALGFAVHQQPREALSYLDQTASEIPSQVAAWQELAAVLSLEKLHLPEEALSRCESALDTFVSHEALSYHADRLRTIVYPSTPEETATQGAAASYRSGLAIR